MLAELAEGSRKRSSTVLDSRAPRTYCRSRSAGSRALSLLLDRRSHPSRTPRVCRAIGVVVCERQCRRVFAPGYVPGGTQVHVVGRSLCVGRGVEVGAYGLAPLWKPSRLQVVCRVQSSMSGPAPTRRCRRQLEKFCEGLRARRSSLRMALSW